MKKEPKIKLCAFHLFQVTPMWGPTPTDIEEVESKDCKHCQENRALMPELLKYFRGEK